MSTDTQQIQEHYELIIQKHASVDLCKECYAAAQCNYQLHCTHDDPTPINCNVLKIHGAF